MHFELNDEQRQLADSVARMGQQHYAFPAWRERVAAGGLDTVAWRRIADLGWLAMNVPEEDGGLDGSPVDTMVLMEGVGRFLMLEPYASSGVLAPWLLRHAAPEARAELMALLAEGKCLISLADGEPNARFELSHVTTTAKPAGEGFVVSGQKSHALDGGDAQWFIVPARTSGEVSDECGVTLFLMPADAPGLSVARARAMDNRVNASLSLDAVAVNAGHVIGPMGSGLPLLREAVDRAIVARLAEALGAMEAVYELTLDYLRTRKQFGQTIGSFQTLQHRAVDMAIACEEARSMTYLATLSLDADPAERSRVVSAAKARVGQTSLYVGRQAVQLHGGVGFSDELAVGHYLKRLIMIDMAFGNADHHRSRLAAMPPAQEAA